MIDLKFWKNKKVFLTGHTGFKGGWLSLWLYQLGAKVYGFALEPPTEPAIFNDAKISTVLEDSTLGDIRDADAFIGAMQKANPDIVVHMAAQSLVRESYINPAETYAVNVMGTVNMFEAVRQAPSVKAVLNITTDKCYENKEWLWGYRENEPMGGHDPYSSSKGCAELVSSAYRRSFFHNTGVALATARAGNVIGGGDWSKDRIIPDAMRAFMANQVLKVRNPTAVRPWQHVFEPLRGYIMLCQKLIQDPDHFFGGWNFGPRDADACPVSMLADIMIKNWGNVENWESDPSIYPHEARYLKLDCSKANSLLEWSPVWDLDRSLKETVEWYKAWHHQTDMHIYSMKQIECYCKEDT